MHAGPTVDEELSFRAAGHRTIAGIDEAGRGCWAGPVVAGAVVLGDAVLGDPTLLAGVNDSKALSAAARANLYTRIVSVVDAWGVGAVPAHIVDTHGILEATKIAMQVALLKLPLHPDALLIDAVKLPNWPCPQRSLIKGDARCLSIAAASILAKVTRDWLMAALGTVQPDYGFARHKGYGTAAHRRALQAYGPSSQHRWTFHPISAWAATGAWPEWENHLLRIEH